ncbi:endolytic transglycosylase MltG [Streptomyces sp. SP18CS02]|uniref:endolytic transglycosylase MltG n=1 Tax=Streptomyces sp. SP18CS02 TaxID=3002531 RepID=UPI002E75ABD3|nr:endolytic transglycosylase MltG [Streptomyces sp. SP18CS02]MEE1751022.1 endolytic transglycosylase MltG [Streptomyces sp. SP18CS02]
MTEYGRGPGSEPWHPEDPAYGDQGWRGQQADGRQEYYQQPQDHAPYGNQQDPYQQPGLPHQQPQSYGDQQYDAGGYGTADHQARNYQGQDYRGQDYQGQDYQGLQHGGQQHAGPHQGQQYDPSHQGRQYDEAQYAGGWDPGQQAAMPYGGPVPADPYGGQNPDLYGTPEAYPPPQPPGQRRAEPEPATEWEPETSHETPGEQQEETHPFFSGDDGRGDDDAGDGHDDDPAAPRGGGGTRRGKGKGKPKKKSRNGLACLVVALVLAGGVGGVGYFGYQFWQNQFGAAPDYEGSGSDATVQVEIPQGAGGYEIAALLVKNGVVKSQGAFVSAQDQNPDGKKIQAGVYTLNKEMSAADAVKAMLNPASRNALIIPEGKRNVWVYEQIDKRLDLKAGTTKDVAEKKASSLGLPDWAVGHKDVKDPLEGFLFPASYPVAKGAKPEDVLKKMVARANQEYGKLDLDAKAETLGLEGPWELVTVASMVQVEGKYKHDFEKVSRVVYNRLKPGNVETVGRLEFDSTINYIKAESTLDVGTVAELRKIKDPYNTYDIQGLTPGPISNPGIDAINSAINPAPGPWYYFVSVNENKTVFSVTNEEHNKNVAEYEKEREKSEQ